jgi:hypothetical protein
MPEEEDDWHWMLTEAIWVLENSRCKHHNVEVRVDYNQRRVKILRSLREELETIDDEVERALEDTDCPECAINGGAHRPGCSRAQAEEVERALDEDADAYIERGRD